MTPTVKRLKSEADCRNEIERMLKKSQTKTIMPVIVFGVLQIFTGAEVKSAYETGVRNLKQHLGHDVNIGGKYEDAYGMGIPAYGFFITKGHKRYALTPVFKAHAVNLCAWLPDRIKVHIESKLGIVPQLSDLSCRATIASDEKRFFEILSHQLSLNASGFEIASFAIIKVHLEHFACKIYRDTKTSAHDRGVDLATNFGVVYQIKKLRVMSRPEADKLYTELKLNFDRERLQEGNVILVIDDVSEDVRRYLIDMKVQSIKKDYLLSIAKGFDEPEDRQKVLRVISDEFRRDYSSAIN
jgi:hypothetical protein